MGLLQTEESDCKMALDYESDSDSAPEDDILEGDRSEEGGDQTPPPRGNVVIAEPPSPPPPSPPPPPPTIGNDANAADEDFVQFMSKDWHGDFSFFPCVPPFDAANVGLHLEGMTGHASLDSSW